MVEMLGVIIFTFKAIALLFCPFFENEKSGQKWTKSKAIAYKAIVRL